MLGFQSDVQCRPRRIDKSQLTRRVLRDWNCTALWESGMSRRRGENVFVCTRWFFSGIQVPNPTMVSAESILFHSPIRSCIMPSDLDRITTRAPTPAKDIRRSLHERISSLPLCGRAQIVTRVKSLEPLFFTLVIPGDDVESDMIFDGAIYTRSAVEMKVKMVARLSERSRCKFKGSYTNLWFLWGRAVIPTFTLKTTLLLTLRT